VGGGSTPLNAGMNSDHQQTENNYGLPYQSQPLRAVVLSLLIREDINAN
jgi:hypothetical protein